MKGFLTTHKGMEDIAALEVKELIDKIAQVNETCIVFDIKKYQDLFRLCYLSQSAIGIYYLISEFNFKDIFRDFKKNIKKIDLSEWLSKNNTFRVRCRKNYENKISTQEIEKNIGEIIINYIKKEQNYKQKVDLTNPDVILFIYLNKNKCYIGIDFAGFDLSKRTHNIFSHPAAIKGTIAYSFVRLSEFKKNETMLDCFSSSGTIPIEAALFASKFPVNYYNKEKFSFLKFNNFNKYNFNNFFREIDNEIKNENLKIYNIDNSMKYINYAKKNSKIAGVDKKIIFSRMDLEWLDTKFDEGKIDKIVTKMPLSQSKNIDKIYNEFFYQAHFVLKDKGKIILIGKKDLIVNYYSKHKFKINSKKCIYSGNEEYNIFILTKHK